MTGAGAKTEINHITETDSGNHHTDINPILDKVLEEIISKEVTEDILEKITGLTEIEVGQKTDFFRRCQKE